MVSHVRRHLRQQRPGPALADPGRDRPGAADGGPGPHGDEHRAAVGPAGAALHDRRPAVGGHRVLAGVRQPAAARRPLADLLGRKVTFMAGLAGFAVVSAIGGASVSFAMLITARAAQGAFAALLVPSALSLLTTTFTEPKDRGKAFGIFGAIAGPAARSG